MSEGKPKAPVLSSWLHISAQLVVFGFCVYWYWHPPLPNKAVLILTGVTVVMALLEMRPRHKIIYLLLVICLMSIENRAINKDREEASNLEDKRREEERKKFQEIADGLQSAINQSALQFNQTMQRSDAIVAGVGNSINAQTGGDSFAYISFTLEPANVSVNGFPPSSRPQFLASITSHGKYPLKETHCTLMDDERRSQAALEYNKHPDGNVLAAINSADTQYYIRYLRPQSPEAPTGDVEMLGLYPTGAKDANDLTVGCSSLNGYWNERLHLRRINGHWHQSLSVMGPTVTQYSHPFIYFDPDYPEGKALAENDWKPIQRQRKGKN